MSAQSNLAVIPGNSTGTAKDELGRFVSGPGNTGRPRGSRNKLSSEMLASIKQMGPEAIERVRDTFRDKDNPSHWKAVELILRYCLPPARTVELDNAEPETIKNAFIDGEMTADEIKSAAAALEKLKNVASMDDIMRHLQELTAFAKQQPNK
ncbi:hypothetical protein [Bradyrhizobium sp. LTSPM299]|uniref:hypothetical protein n=1 Tax=Bradyrhizobium sp. LTSPM299 TaxID=1619233 RepID=UPI000AB6F838|nr:hypothetical protein [Bradyrhizobium sp. LTSPM299]